jgi:uncharacterized protein
VRRAIELDQGRVIEFLSRSETYGISEPVETITTHISQVFLAGERVYKLKRAVRFPYLDFADPARRKRACEDELRLNRRTAPNLYLKVATVTRAPDGTLAIDGTGEAVDWLVVMRRFDQDLLFDRLAQAGKLTRAQIEELAETVARFHADAEVDRTRGGGAAMASIARDLAGGLEAEVAKVGALLDRRRDAGFVRRCHGDLHLRNIVLLDDKPTPFDCIEFNDNFAVIDVMYDLGFLLMDLEHRNLRELSNALMNRTIDLSGDVEGVALLPLFMAIRAAVRASVSTAQGLTDEARAFSELRSKLMAPSPPVMIAVGGLSGSGKSTFARELAPVVGRAPGALVIRSDTTRKRLAGVSLTERLDAQAYTPEAARDVYTAMNSLAETALKAGHSAVLDAVFAQPDERDAARDLATKLGVPFHGFWLDLPLSVRQSRIGGRKHDASDATAEVARAQENYDLGPVDWQMLDAAQDLKSIINQALTAL